MLVLGIETSCDETAAAVVRSTGEVLSDVVHSQVKLHAPYGGVVPELASRDHLNNMGPVFREALSRASLDLEQIDAIAVTCRPGLTGALLVGVQMARGLAWAANKPLVGVDHLVGHLLAVFLKHPGIEAAEPPTFPYIALLASGGHTAIYQVRSFRHEDISELGATRDDAAGEAFDKIAKLLGLGYPGGPIVDRLAADGDPSALALARPMPRRDSYEFSFSGLKTNVARWVEKHGRPESEQALKDLCASFQGRVVDSLLSKTVRAARRLEIETVVLAGGVAANRELRQRAIELGERYDLRVVIPPFRSCTDNAAMIAFAGAQALRQGHANEAVTISPRTLLPRATRKGRGRRTPVG